MQITNTNLTCFEKLGPDIFVAIDVENNNLQAARACVCSCPVP